MLGALPSMLTAVRLATAAASPACPRGTVAVGASADGVWTVCEVTLSADRLTGALVPSGELRFLHATNGSMHIFHKTSEAMYGCGGRHANATDGCYLGLDPGQQMQCATCQDELFSRIGNYTDPSYEVVKAIWPPLVWDGGWDYADPAHDGSWKGRPDQQIGCGNVNGHTFVGSRSATQTPTFDSNGMDFNQYGFPGMSQFLTKYHRSTAVFKDRLSLYEQREGLWGGFLPVISLHFKISGPGSGPPAPTHINCTSIPQPCPSHPGRTFCASNPASGQCDQPSHPPCPPCPPPPSSPVGAVGSAVGKQQIDESLRTEGASGGWIEFTACPVADMKGNQYQDVMFRVMKFNATGGIIDARYFDTYAFRTLMKVPGMGYPAGSDVSKRFYTALLEQKVFWAQTFAAEAAEGVVQFDLPGSASGKQMGQMVYHSLIRDMIIRADTWWPKYGVPGTTYGGPVGDNVDLSLESSLTIALALGAHDYARGVLENFLGYGYRMDGPRFRGPSLTEQAGQLQLMAQYYTQTGDPTDIFRRHLPKIMNYIHEFRAVRAKALTLPKSDPAYGVPAGNTIDDLWGTAIECGTTFPDGSGGPQGDCNVALPDYHIAWGMIGAFRSMAKAFQHIGGTVGIVAVASGGSAISYNLTAEAESMLAESLQLLKDTAVAAARSAVPAEGLIIDGRNVSCYPCHAGWSSCKTGFKEPGFVRPSADIMCHAMSVPAYAAEVWPPQLYKDVNDYKTAFEGKSQKVESTNDQVRRKLFDWFQYGANGMTRGTWTGAEYRNYALAPSSGTTTRGTSIWAAQFIEWFVREETTNPHSLDAPEVLHFGAMIPRNWLANGEHVGVHAVPLSLGGRVSLMIDTAADGSSYTVNISVPVGFSWPGGGLVLTIRSPAWPRKCITAAQVGGAKIPSSCINATEETLSFIQPPDDLSDMQRIQVQLA